jgi:cathepsin L
MMRLLYSFLTLIPLIAANNKGLDKEENEGVSSMSALFDAYLDERGRSFEKSESDYKRRQQVFIDNWHFINKHNQKDATTYKLGIHQYSDLLPEEVPKGYVKPAAYHHHHSSSNSVVTTTTGRRVLNTMELESILRTEPVQDLPKSVDWRKKGITTPVKNQYYCGSCWAFASTAVIESHVARATGTLFSLS